MLDIKASSFSETSVILTGYTASCEIYDHILNSASAEFRCIM